MTVSSEVSSFSYATDGATTSFPVPFYFLAAPDLRVWLHNEASDSSTDLEMGTDYDVTGAGQASGGAVITRIAHPQGLTLRGERLVPITQETAYQRNDPFPERAHEKALDKLTMICQQLAAILGWGPGSRLRALLLGRDDIDGQGAYRARGNRITNLGDPQTDTDAVNRRSMFSFVSEYVDRAIAGVSGGFGWFLQSGSGAVARTFQDKMRESVSVVDYGADPSGQTDSTTAIDAALQETDSPYFPDGTYLYGGDIDALFARNPQGPGSVRFDGLDYKILRHAATN
ncbi:hypothetical protein HLB01_05475, partial [Bordetella trematum]